MRRDAPKFSFGDTGQSAGRRELDDRPRVESADGLAAQIPAHRASQLGDELVHGVGRGGNRPAVEVGQQRDGRIVRDDTGGRGGVSVHCRCHVVGVERPGGGQLAHPGLRRRIFGQFLQRCQRSRSDDLPDGVAVGRDQIKGVESGQHVVLVPAENSGHAGRLSGAGLGHLGTAYRGEFDRVIAADHTGDGVSRDLTDGMPGNNGVGVRR